MRKFFLDFLEASTYPSHPIPCGGFVMCQLGQAQLGFPEFPLLCLSTQDEPRGRLLGDLQSRKKAVTMLQPICGVADLLIRLIGVQRCWTCNGQSL